MISKTELVKGLRNLGIKSGDVIFLRISYKSIGKTENGPKDIIDSILEVIGNEGTIVAATYPKLRPTRLKWFYKNPTYNRTDHSISVYTGAISSTILKYPTVMSSENPTVMFSAIGKYAKTLTDNYKIDKKPYHILLEMVENYDAKCLRVGGQTLTGTTHLALADAFSHHNAYQRKVHSGIYVLDKNGNKIWIDTRHNTTFCYTMFNQFYNDNFRQKDCVIAEGKIGLGNAVLTSMQKTYKVEKDMFLKDIDNLTCNNAECLTCNLTYSFSKSNRIKFLFNQFFYLFSVKKRKIARKNIKRYMQILLLGTRCK